MLKSGVDPLLPPGVLLLQRGWLSSNNILMVGETSTALVDSGYSTHSDLTLALVVAKLGGRQLDLLINTHLHSDHCGGNAALQAAYPGLRTWIPPGQEAAVRAWDRVALTFEPTGQQCPRFRIDGVMRPGQAIVLGDLPWEVHAAPGHDPHSAVLFHRPSRTLLSADALWEHGFGVVFPELEGVDAFREVAATLDLIASLKPLVVVPGHGPAFADVPGALGRAHARLDAFLASPIRHADHAAKVLVKFKLLELQQVSVPELRRWAAETHYLQLLHRTWHPTVAFNTWLDSLVGRLQTSGALTTSGNLVTNL